jgi:hypothetical protein
MIGSAGQRGGALYEIMTSLMKLEDYVSVNLTSGIVHPLRFFRRIIDDAVKTHSLPDRLELAFKGTDRHRKNQKFF